MCFNIIFQEGSTPVMLAVVKEHKDVAILLIEKKANLELFDEVSVGIIILYYKQCITENK